MPVSHLEERFARYWLLYSDYPLQQEYTDERIKGKRNKLPFDFRIIGTPVLIEIQGATHIPNRGHTSAKGIKRDCVKANMALMCGYLPFAFTAAMITHEKVKELADYVRQEFGNHTAVRQLDNSGRRNKKPAS